MGNPICLKSLDGERKGCDTFFQQAGRGRSFSVLILDEDGVFSSIISKGHGDLQFAFSSLLLVGDFVSDGKKQSYSYRL